MAVTRSDAADYVAGMFAEQLTDAGIATTDTTGDLKEPIDAALRMTGTSQGDLATATVDDDDAGGFFTVLDYTTLLRIQRAILARVDVTLDGPQMSKSRSQAVRQTEKAVDDARKAAEPFIVTDTGAWSVSVLSTDYIEPEDT